MSPDKIDDGGAILQAAQAAGMHVDCGTWTGTTAQVHAFVEAVSRVALRDHFAAMAMQGELACQREGYEWGTSDKLATNSYAIADAMLKARSA